jgi:hypothetical protein
LAAKAKAISIMTDLFSFIAHEDAQDQTKTRQAMALAKERVEDRFGAFVRKGSVDDQAARFDLVAEDVKAVVAATCEQVGVPLHYQFYKAIADNFVTADAAPQLRTASVRHEARKPKMCPYHSEVTDISLAQGEPQAGFNAMAQHAWGARHCQGEEYKGDRCKFKPEMTTQSYWDGRAEKLEQKRQERAEREEQQRVEQEQQVTELPQLETPTEDVPENAEVPSAAEQGDIVEHNEPSAIGEGVEEAVPMAMAASIAKVAQTGPGQFEVTLSSGQTFPVQAKDEWEARQRAIQQNVAQGGQTSWATKVADAGPVPKMDKSKWKPTREPLDVDDEDGPHPTKHKDVTEPIKQEQGERTNPSKLTEIGEQVTERQDVAEDTGVSTSGQGGTFGGGERSAVSSKQFEGMLSPEAVRTALSKFKR